MKVSRADVFIICINRYKMKSLKSFIYESINPQLKSVSIKLVDRSFKESISDEDFVKFLKQDIDKCLIHQILN